MAEAKTLGEGKYIRLIQQGHWEYAVRTNVTGIVVLVPITDAGELVLIEQHRIPVGASVVELPAGLVGDVPGTEDEPLEEAAKRELLEETGFSAASLDLLCEGPATAGMTDEILTFYRTVGLTHVDGGGGDEHEDITVHVVPLDQVHAFLDERRAAGSLVDVKVYTGLYFARRGA